MRIRIYLTNQDMFSFLGKILYTVMCMTPYYPHLSLRGVSGCNSSTIGGYPSIFATIEGYCNSSEVAIRADVE